MDLTGEQGRVVEHAGGRMRVVGGAGTGKTTALVARYRRLVAGDGGVRASAVLVLCRTRAAADRFRDAVLPDLAGAFDSLPVTTFFGLAYDLVSRHVGPVTLLTGAEQRHAVARLLAADDPSDWPTLGHLLGRAAFAAEVADGLLLPSSHPELVAFAGRYREALAADHRVDASGLLAQAAELLADPTVAAAVRARTAHVLVDDYHAVTGTMATMLERLGVADVVVAGDPDGAVGGFPGADRGHLARFPADIEVDLGRDSFRRPTPPVLVTTRHPSIEPEAVAGELLAAHAAGVAWSDMAVLVRRPRLRAPAVARALARHGIPARTAAAAAVAAVADDPVVGSIVDMLRWADGDESALDRLLVSPLSELDGVEARRLRLAARMGPTAVADDPRLARLVSLRDDLAARSATDTPAELAFQVWEQALGHLVDPRPDAPDPDDADSDDAVLDGLVAFLDALRRESERNPGHRLADLLAVLDDEGVVADPWRVDTAAATAADAVTVTSILTAAGREWDTVVLAGCVEGELPSLRRRGRLLGGRTPDLAEERRLFALACSRATGRMVATAGPEPGVLLSRFVEGWPAADLRIPGPPGRAPSFRRPTANPRPIAADAGLLLSATQLDTYDDCPLRYAYRYVLRVRDEGGVRADLGTLVHEVLARFLDPETAGERPHTEQTLLAMAEEMWRHDIARYRPQVEEARRDFFAMLGTWWQLEGQSELAPDVVAVERSFDIAVGGHRLRGSIDRIDRVEGADGSPGLRVVDYKTGKKEPRPGEVDDNIQLAVYHLAATRDPALAALGPVTELRLLFLRTMRSFDQEVAADHAQATEKRVLDVAAHVRAEEFEPAVDATCRWCDFQRLCPIQPEGRQVESTWP